MSERSNVNTMGFTVPWLLIFVVVKVGGTALASWSWWWLLAPVVPVVVLACKGMGWL